MRIMKRRNFMKRLVTGGMALVLIPLVKVFSIPMEKYYAIPGSNDQANNIKHFKEIIEKYGSELGNINIREISRK